MEGEQGLITDKQVIESLVAGTHCTLLQMLFLGFSLGLAGLCSEMFKTSLFISLITKENFRSVENMRPL